MGYIYKEIDCALIELLLDDIYFFSSVIPVIRLGNKNCSCSG